MNILIIDISSSCIRAVLSNDGVFEYSKTFDFEAIFRNSQADETDQESIKKFTPATENPYLLYSELDNANEWNYRLNSIISEIRSDLNNNIDETHLIIPSNEVIIETHQLPKMARQNVEKLISRKISAESKEEYPPYAIIPSASDSKTDSWYSFYVPTTTLNDYRKAFSFCKMRLTSITTSINAMLDAFSSVREAIFNAHAIFEIQHNYIEAYYISSSGLLYFERLPFAATTVIEDPSVEEEEKRLRQKIFKTINTIFSLNFHYQTTHPTIPVQLAWICGVESELDEIATSLKESIGFEVAIAPAIPTGLDNESSYVSLSGFAAALQRGTATSYNAASFYRRFPLRKTYGISIYALTAITSMIAIFLTEREYNDLKRQVPQAIKSDSKNSQKRPEPIYKKNLETMQKLTSQQFVFYDLFRNLANDLPTPLFLENVEYKFKDEKGNINITATAQLGTKVDSTDIPSKLMSMLDNSSTLKNHVEPVISTSTIGKDKFIKFVIKSEVKPFDKTK